MALRDPALVGIFDRATAALFREYPSLPHHGIEGGFAIPASSATGFEVSVQASPDGLVVGTGTGLHVPFDDDRPSEQLVRYALGMVLEMLSEHARIIELRAGGMAYRWRLEFYRDGRWESADSMGLLIWNFLGRRTQTTYQNSYFSTSPLEKNPTGEP